ncbi:hypothetical protein BDY21DRAFT_421530 [Lineolata rhizophorae]|uniref:Uncharacterized protein n=1 Tax=Lineolata rhizophorae TaxID=578093 RepID=A0A6A6P0P4_9PEZI|nr:hypothetical protein BDY21DRAFT_421530 [Lineolata rhizophorae]
MALKAGAGVEVCGACRNTGSGTRSRAVTTLAPLLSPAGSPGRMLADEDQACNRTGRTLPGARSGWSAKAAPRLRTPGTGEVPLSRPRVATPPRPCPPPKPPARGRPRVGRAHASLPQIDCCKAVTDARLAKERNSISSPARLPNERTAQPAGLAGVICPRWVGEAGVAGGEEKAAFSLAGPTALLHISKAGRHGGQGSGQN